MVSASAADDVITLAVLPKMRAMSKRFQLGPVVNRIPAVKLALSSIEALFIASFQ